LVSPALWKRWETKLRGKRKRRKEGGKRKKRKKTLSPLMDTRQQPDSGYFTMHEECGKRGEIATNFRSLLTREPLVFGTAVGIS